MSLYSLELLKRSGLINESSTGNLDSRTEKSQEKSQYDVFGYYDFLEVQKFESFEELSKILTSGGSHSSNHYSRHTMTLFDIHLTEQTVDSKTLINKMAEGECEHFILVFSCVIRKDFRKVNEGLHKDKRITTGKAAIMWAENQLDEKLKKWKSDNDEKANYQILGNLGSFDITILVGSDHLERLIELPNCIRGEFEDETIDNNKKYESKDKEDTVVYSSSFIACSLEQLAKKKSNIQSCYTERLNLNMHMVMFNVSADNYVMSELRKIVGQLNTEERTHKITHTFSKIVGEYSIEAHFQNMCVPDIIELFNNPLLNYNDENHKKCFRAVYSLVGVNIPDPELINLSGVEPIDLAEPPDDWKTRALCRSDLLKKKYEVIETLSALPSHTQDTLGDLVQTAISMVYNDLKYILGQSMVLLLTEFLEYAYSAYLRFEEESDIKTLEEYKQRWTSDIETFVTACSSLFQSFHPQACFLQDSRENQNEINTVLKVFLSYQQIVRDVASAVNVRQHKKTLRIPNQVLVTVGAEGRFITRSFDLPRVLGSDKNQHEEGFIMTLNFPNAKSLFICDIIAPFTHEVGHNLIFYSGHSFSNLNKAVHKMIFRFCVEFIYGPYSSRKDLNKRKKKGIKKDIAFLLHDIITDIYSSVSNKAPGTPPPELVGNIFLLTLREKWHDLLVRIGDYGSEFNEDCSALASNWDHVRALFKAAWEARADVLMMLLMYKGEDFSLKNYLKTMRKYFGEDLKLKKFPEQQEYIYRFSMILCMFYIDAKSKTKDKIDAQAWWKKQYSELEYDIREMIDSSCNRWVSHASIVQPFAAEYMCGLRKEFENNLERSVKKDVTSAKLVEELLTINNATAPVLENEIWLYVDAWFRGREHLLAEWDRQQTYSELEEQLQ